jgi:uncharacterized protein (UPF0332 family)
MPLTLKQEADSWRARSGVSLRATRALFVAENWYGVANRAYYAAYQACTSLCIEHGDAVHFPKDRNNPSHEQVSDLIQNNGSLSQSTRRQVKTNLAFLRENRVNADYRPGTLVDKDTALRCLRFAVNVTSLLGVNEEEK